MEEIEKIQIAICEKWNTEYTPSPMYLKVGISLNIKHGGQPINGLRHQQVDDTSGWYIWGGEYSDADDFFIPLHIEHLNDWCPEVLKFLGLPPGYRFLFDNKGYEDVWLDENLLDI